MDDIGRLVLRVTPGGLLLFHGLAKLRHGIDPITGMVTAAGLPAFVAYGVYIGEVAAPLALLVGWCARVAAAVIAMNMTFAVALAHTGDLFTIGRSGGWALELQGF